MPGDLRALNEAGEMKLLITYGMVGVELIGDAGEQLQIAAGKSSTLSFPIPASIQPGFLPMQEPLFPAWSHRPFCSTRCSQYLIQV